MLKGCLTFLVLFVIAITALILVVSIFGEDKGTKGASDKPTQTPVVPSATNTQEPTEIATQEPTATLMATSTSLPSTANGATAAQRLTVSAIDLAFEPKEFSIAQGSVIHLVNNGVLPHQLTIEGPNGAIVGSAVIYGGAVTDLVVPVDLAPGEYAISCSVPGHAAAGMVGTITVTSMVIPAAVSPRSVPKVATATPTRAATALPLRTPTRVPTTVPRAVNTPRSTTAPHSTNTPRPAPTARVQPTAASLVSDCSPFANYDNAQRYYAANPAAQPIIDPDYDGYACEVYFGVDPGGSTSVVIPNDPPDAPSYPVDSPPMANPPADAGPIYTDFGGLDGVDYDCYDFASPGDAQAYFNTDGGSSYNNADGLDRNHNGLACEPGEFD